MEKIMEHAWVKEYIHKLFEENFKDNAHSLRDEKLQHINRPFYKYCYVCENANRNESTIDYNIENFKNEVLFFQNPSKFNDPFDCFLGFSQTQLIKDLLLQEMRRKKQLTPALRNLVNSLFETNSAISEINQSQVNDFLSSVKELLNSTVDDDPAFSYIPKLLSSLAEKDLNLLNRLLTGNLTIIDKQNIIDFIFDNSYFHDYFISQISPENADFIYDAVKHDMKLKIENLPQNDFLNEGEDGASFSVLSYLLNLSTLLKSDEFTTEDLNNIKQKYDVAAKEILIKGRKLISEQFRITCLSERMDSPLMWSHYANKHYGFCLEYDFTLTMTSMRYRDLPTAQIMLFPVIYSNERPLLSKALFDSKNAYKYLKSKKLPPQALEKLMYGLLVKSNDWEYEKEWRIFQITGETTMKLPKPRKLFLGANMEEEAKQKLILIAKEKHIPVIQMFLKADKYNFDYYQIN